MIYNKLGTTNLEISLLGYGAGHIGSDDIDKKSVSYLLDFLQEQGINFIDTARGYGASEERVGKFVSKYPREKNILCTKFGYGVDGVEDWTYDCIIKGVERALSVMNTTYIDVALLHTCPKYILEKYDVIKALEDCKQKGYVRAIGYSGDNEDMEYAVNIEAFDCFEGSFNLFDQAKSSWILGKIRNDNKGFIAKRPIGNAPWRFEATPIGNYCEAYWHRMKAMNIELDDMSWTELALRFSLFTCGVTTGIIGSTNVEHIKENISYLEKGKLSDEKIAQIKEAFFNNGQIWRSEV